MILRSERGQSAVIAVLFLTALLGMTAAVLDVGSWFRAQRRAQAQADASALAGAQLLPSDPNGAIATAISYAKENGVTISANDVSFPAADTIRVDVRSTEPGFFSKVFGITTVTVHAHGAARAYQPSEARYLAPIVVWYKHPALAGPGCPCYGQQNETTLPLRKILDQEKHFVPGAFGMLDFDNSNGATGSSTLASWITKGFDKYLPPGGYYSDPGAKFNSNDIDAALSDRIGKILMFPVYDYIAGGGSQADYHIIGWVGFRLKSYTVSGTVGSLDGWFEPTVWDGRDVLPAGDTGTPDLGVRSVQLVQ